MATETPMGPGARLVLVRDDDDLLMSVEFQADDGTPREPIAQMLPAGRYEQFEWLVNSAAAFHKIPVEEG